VHPLNGKRVPLLAGDHVTIESGSGLVHTAPGHGEDDFAVCRPHNIDILCPVNESGMFTNDAGMVHGSCLQMASTDPSTYLSLLLLHHYITLIGPELAGKDVLKNGNTAVMNMLSKCGSLLHREEYKHRYPYDWRTKKPIIFRATNQYTIYYISMPFTLYHTIYYVRA
jgi:isoleucyl-tRNA synthetase